MSTHAFPRAVLFDLDGTLLDSAPDMLAAANAMRAARSMPAMALDAIRPHVSRGARAMATAAFPGIALDDVRALVPEFLDCYQRELGRHGAAFDGVEAMLAALEGAGTRWGIVTNKPYHLAEPLVPMLGWAARCGVLVGGDTYAQAKPHPLPLLEAAKTLGVDPVDCVYVGDDARDIEAARAAGMRSVVALWGYRVDGDDPATWGGDVLLESAQALADAAAWPALPAVAR